MEPLTIITSIALPLLAWCLLNTHQHGKQISSLRVEMSAMRDDIGKIDQKINLFLKTEIDTMKDIARESTAAMKEIAKK